MQKVYHSIQIKTILLFILSDNDILFKFIFLMNYKYYFFAFLMENGQAFMNKLIKEIT